MKLLFGLLVASAVLSSPQSLGSPTCRFELMSSVSSAAIMSQPSGLTKDLYSLPITLPRRRKEIITQVYVVQPKDVSDDAPVVMLNPGLSKDYESFVDHAHRLARKGYIVVTYNHLNVGTPVVGSLKRPTVEEDALLAQQVYNSLPEQLTSRKLLLVPHSRGALVAASLAHKLAEQGVEIAGLVAFQPYIYWQLEHMFNQLSSKIEQGIADYFKNMIPIFARILYPISSRIFDNTAEVTAKTMAMSVREITLNSILAAQTISDTAAENTSFPTILRMALRQVLPAADSNTITQILEKLKGMQPEIGQDAPFLGDYLEGLQMPIQIISAEVDDLSSVEMAESLASHMERLEQTNVQFEILEEEGHYFPYAKPSSMVEIIDLFWRNLASTE
ncbi:MAG: hypothetical protein AAF202_00970 [Pseudomonadota bacterium]